MSFEDRGKYITLLSYMHQTGRLTESVVRILINDISDNLKAKFKIDKNGLWYNERLEEEIARRKNFVSSRRKNGRLGGRPKENKAKQKEMKPIPVKDDTYPFAQFWKMYGKPTEKQSCESKWNRLDEGDKEIIFNRLPAYVEATPERQFRKNPLTYLNRRTWLDEILPDPPNPVKKSAFELLVETGKLE
jgi:hypothetical protein